VNSASRFVSAVCVCWVVRVVGAVSNLLSLFGFSAPVLGWPNEGPVQTKRAGCKQAFLPRGCSGKSVPVFLSSLPMFLCRSFECALLVPPLPETSLGSSFPVALRARYLKAANAFCLDFHCLFTETTDPRGRKVSPPAASLPCRRSNPERTERPALFSVGHSVL